ncbi:MAG TPA: hypothetical protein VGJ66_07065 [Pyrinomonadaceae bacterium]|jgi:hypothetical protein
MLQPLMSTRPTRRRLTVTLLVSFALAMCNVVPLLQAQTPPKSDAASKLAEETKKVKERILKISRGNDVTIVRRDGREFYGRIESLEDDRVSIYEVDLKAKIEIYFEEIKKVSKGYGSTRAWNGKRIPPKKRLIGLIIGIGVLILPVILIANGKD